MDELFNEIEIDNPKVKDNKEKRDKLDNKKKKKLEKEPRIDIKNEEIPSRNKKF